MINTINDDINILHDVNKKIYEIASKIYQQLGTGHTEFIYHRAMEIELRLNNYIYETEKRILINYHDEKGHIYNLGEERVDLYIHDYDVIIELKAIVNSPKESEIAQVYKYYRELKKIGLNPKYGILINFPQAGVKVAKDKIDFVEIVL